MKQISIVYVSKQSHLLARTLLRELREIHAESEVIVYEPVENQSVQSIVDKVFPISDALVFIGSTGICVRMIAHHVNDKHSDPAVVCVDSTGKYAISLLSGHIGGANDLCREVASITGGEAVVSTLSDNSGLWALDTLGKEYGWRTTVTSRQMNNAVFAFVNKKPTALLLEAEDKGTDYLLSSKPDHVQVFRHYDELKSFLRSQKDSPFSLLLIVSPRQYPGLGVSTLQYFPPVLHLGFGCQKQAPIEIASQVLDEIRVSGYATESIATISTIELKADEPMFDELLRLCPGSQRQVYTASELNQVKIPNPSEKVFEATGVYGVAEAAARKSGGKESMLVIEKQKGKIQVGDRIAHYTFALASEMESQKKGHVEIVGAGPGDPELVSVRGRKFLEKADLVLYAGSLVPRELTYCAKPGATVRSSASMDLEEQFDLMKRFYDKGKLIVRLHTGDPCIYGAIEEQMNYFDQHNMRYHITPGISSFQAAAAELRSQFTIPEKVQTIILTRGEGRTPMPEREKLHLLARSQSTMCIYLSASIAEQVQDELLQCYPEDTPVAVCHKLTWKEQRIFRGVLKDLAKIVKSHHLTLTTMIVVGEAIDNREGKSKLYDKGFTHQFRTSH